MQANIVTKQLSYFTDGRGGEKDFLLKPFESKMALPQTIAVFLAT